jgi:hypothetical protein
MATPDARGGWRARACSVGVDLAGDADMRVVPRNRQESSNGRLFTASPRRLRVLIAMAV